MFYFRQTLSFLPICQIPKQFLRYFHAQPILLQNRSKSAITKSIQSILLVLSTTNVLYQKDSAIAFFQRATTYTLCLTERIRFPTTPSCSPAAPTDPQWQQRFYPQKQLTTPIFNILRSPNSLLQRLLTSPASNPIDFSAIH